jgi:carbon monoxide dehydrogenase subunit G
VKIEEHFDVAQDPAIVYREINDVAGIGKCIAGVQQIEILSEDESRWTVEVSAGFMAMTMDFDARIVERVEPERVGFAAEGQNVALTGHVAIAANATGGSDCAVVIDATPRGPLAPLMDQMGRGVQEQLARKTIANVRARLQEASDSAARAPDDRPPQLPVVSGPPRNTVRFKLPRQRGPAWAALAVLAACAALVGGWAALRRRRR